MIQGDLFGHAAPVRALRKSYREVGGDDVEAPACYDCHFVRGEPLWRQTCTLLKREVASYGICDAHEYRDAAARREHREYAQWWRGQEGRMQV